jgi:predicted translin family RNA/ssDNA-binding protein
MLNKTDLAQMRKAVHEYDKKRELLIKKSRDVLKLSKQIIYAVHRDDLKKASLLIRDIRKEKATMEKIAQHSPAMLSEGSFKVSLQEYAEALLYYSIITHKKMATRKEVDVPTYHYILGLCDVTGELVRKAVHLAGKSHVDDVVAIKNLVDEIFGELLAFDFRDNETRRKFDSVKYDLKKLEDLVLQLKLKG